MYIWEEFPLPQGLRAVALPLSPGIGSHAAWFEASFYYLCLESTLEIIRDCCLLGQKHGEVKFRPFFRSLPWEAIWSPLQPLKLTWLTLAKEGMSEGDWDLESAPLCWWLYQICTSCPNNKASIWAFSDQLVFLQPSQLQASLGLFVWCLGPIFSTSAVVY